IDDDEVAHALDAAVAEDGRALADQVLSFDVSDLQLDQLAREGERAQLQEAELLWRRGRRGKVDGELDLHRSAGALCRDLQQESEDVREREDLVLEDGRERHEADAGASDPIV